MRDLPFDAIEFPFYEFLKSSFRRHLKRDLFAWENSLCGCLAGGVTAAVTTPLDVIKTRIMTSPDLYGNMADCLVKILANEGPQVNIVLKSDRPSVHLHRLHFDLLTLLLLTFIIRFVSGPLCWSASTSGHDQHRGGDILWSLGVSEDCSY